MLRILVAGGHDDDDDAARSDIEAFCRALGECIAGQGHTLLNGCRTVLDRTVADAALAKLKDMAVADPDRRVISYVLSNQEPVHQSGTIIRSRLTDWELNKADLYVPEQIGLADAVILIGGFNGTFRAANWARIAKKPLLPVTAFGGAALQIYSEELEQVERHYGSRIDELEFQELNSVTHDWHQLAGRVVSLAEKVATSKRVLAVMSYSGRADIEDAFDSFVTVCSEFDYDCLRVHDANTVDRIVPSILEHLEGAAFVIGDLTELRANVLFEVGFAQGLGRPIVLTAKQGTELPFDVKDMPTIFWDGQKKLREDLRTKIALIADKQGH
jgi:hypothetical protein